MRVHIIDNNVVTNTIEIDSVASAHSLFPASTCVDAGSVIGNIGDIWNGTSLSKPSVDITALKAKIWEDIKAYREDRVQNGGYKVGTHWFHSDTFSRTQQLGLVIAGSNLPTGIQWKTLDNGYTTMTPTLALQIFAAATASDSAVFTYAAAQKATIDASSDPASINWKTGWPTIYGE